MTIPEVIKWDCPRCGKLMEDEFWVFVCRACNTAYPFEEYEVITLPKIIDAKPEEKP